MCPPFGVDTDPDAGLDAKPAQQGRVNRLQKDVVISEVQSLWSSDRDDNASSVGANEELAPCSQRSVENPKVQLLPQRQKDVGGRFNPIEAYTECSGRRGTHKST